METIQDWTFVALAVPTANKSTQSSPPLLRKEEKADAQNSGDIESILAQNPVIQAILTDPLIMSQNKKDTMGVGGEGGSMTDATPSATMLIDGRLVASRQHLYVSVMQQHEKLPASSSALAMDIENDDVGSEGGKGEEEIDQKMDDETSTDAALCGSLEASDDALRKLSAGADDLRKEEVAAVKTEEEKVSHAKPFSSFFLPPPPLSSFPQPNQSSQSSEQARTHTMDTRVAENKEETDNAFAIETNRNDNSDDAAPPPTSTTPNNSIVSPILSFEEFANQQFVLREREENDEKEANAAAKNSNSNGTTTTSKTNAGAARRGENAVNSNVAAKSDGGDDQTLTTPVKKKRGRPVTSGPSDGSAAASSTIAAARPLQPPSSPPPAKPLSQAAIAANAVKSNPLLDAIYNHGRLTPKQIVMRDRQLKQQMAAAVQHAAAAAATSSSTGVVAEGGVSPSAGGLSPISLLPLTTPTISATTPHLRPSAIVDTVNKTATVAIPTLLATSIPAIPRSKKARAELFLSPVQIYAAPPPPSPLVMGLTTMVGGRSSAAAAAGAGRRMSGSCNCVTTGFSPMLPPAAPTPTQKDQNVAMNTAGVPLKQSSPLLCGDKRPLMTNPPPPPSSLIATSPLMVYSGAINALDGFELPMSADDASSSSPSSSAHANTVEGGSGGGGSSHKASSSSASASSNHDSNQSPHTTTTTTSHHHHQVNPNPNQLCSPNWHNATPPPAGNNNNSLFTVLLASPPPQHYNGVFTELEMQNAQRPLLAAPHTSLSALSSSAVGGGGLPSPFGPPPVAPMPTPVNLRKQEMRDAATAAAVAGGGEEGGVGAAAAFAQKMTHNGTANNNNATKPRPAAFGTTTAAAAARYAQQQHFTMDDLNRELIKVQKQQQKEKAIGMVSNNNSTCVNDSNTTNAALLVTANKKQRVSSAKSYRAARALLARALLAVEEGDKEDSLAACGDVSAATITDHENDDNANDDGCGKSNSASAPAIEPPAIDITDAVRCEVAAVISQRQQQQSDQGVALAGDAQEAKKEKGKLDGASVSDENDSASVASAHGVNKTPLTPSEPQSSSMTPSSSHPHRAGVGGDASAGTTGQPFSSPSVAILREQQSSCSPHSPISAAAGSTAVNAIQKELNAVVAVVAANNSSSSSCSAMMGASSSSSLSDRGSAVSAANSGASCANGSRNTNDDSCDATTTTHVLDIAAPTRIEPPTAVIGKKQPKPQKRFRDHQQRGEEEDFFPFPLKFATAQQKKNGGTDTSSSSPASVVVLLAFYRLSSDDKTRETLMKAISTHIAGNNSNASNANNSSNGSSNGRVVCRNAKRPRDGSDGQEVADSGFMAAAAAAAAAEGVDSSNSTTTTTTSAPSPAARCGGAAEGGGGRRHYNNNHNNGGAYSSFSANSLADHTAVRVIPISDLHLYRDDGLIAKRFALTAGEIADIEGSVVSRVAITGL